MGRRVVSIITSHSLRHLSRDIFPLAVLLFVKLLMRGHGRSSFALIAEAHVGVRKLIRHDGEVLAASPAGRSP